MLQDHDLVMKQFFADETVVTQFLYDRTTRRRQLENNDVVMKPFLVDETVFKQCFG